MNRRHFASFAGLSGLSALTACGFKLRQAPSLAFTSLYVGVAEGSLFGNELKRSLGSLGTLQLVSDVKLKQTAQVLLDRKSTRLNSSHVVTSRMPSSD